MFRLALVRPDQIAFVDLANGVCCATMAKTVLVSLEERNRPVTFSGAKENLLEEIRVVFKDQLASEEDVYLQIKDESWGGIFVDFLNQEIPDRSILKATRIIPAVGHREKPAQQDVVNLSCVCHQCVIC